MKLLKTNVRSIALGWVCLITAYTGTAQTYNITDFGAKGDGRTVNTGAIQKAIDKATQQGGTVLVPAGNFITGTIQLKSNVTLYLNRNAILHGVATPSAYPSMPITYPFVANSAQTTHSLIYASRAENIAITGEGTINGNGGDAVFVSELEGKVMRPFVLLIESCRNVTVSGLTLLNSAMWMQRYIGCDFLKLHNLTVFNHVNFNNDGMDIDDCHNVIISDCVIDSDDDALCFKSEGARGVKHVVVTNCILSTHASAFKMGTGSVGGFEAIQFSNSVIRQSLATNLMHPFKQKSGLTGIDLASTDGGVLRDVNISNISIDSLENPIFMKLGNRMSRKPGGKSGVYESVHFSQITIKNAGPVSSAITGYPGAYIRDISFRDIFIEHRGGGSAKDTTLIVAENSNQYPGCRMFKSKLPATGFYARHVKNIQFNNIQVKLAATDMRPAIVCDDVEDLEVQGLKYTANSGAAPELLVIARSNNSVIQCREGDEKRIRQLQNTKIVIKP